MKIIRVFMIAFLTIGSISFAKSGQVNCYSESRAKAGATYYDCGDCTIKFNSKGFGTASFCETEPEIRG